MAIRSEGITKEVEHEAFPQISYEDSLNNIRIYAFDIIEELTEGRNQRHFLSEFTIHDKPDLVQQAFYVCQGAIPLYDPNTNSYQGKSHEIIITNEDGTPKSVEVLDHHYRALSLLVYSHVVDELLDDPNTLMLSKHRQQTATTLRFKLLGEFIAYGHIRKKNEKRDRAANVSELFDIFTNVLFGIEENIQRPIQDPQSYTQTYFKHYPDKEQYEITTLNLQDMYNLFNPLSEVSESMHESSPLEAIKKRYEIAQRNWLNMLIVGLINTGYQYTFNNTESLEQPVEEELGIGRQKEIIELLKEINPFFSLPKIKEIIDEKNFPLEIWLSFGSAVLGMFYVYGEQKINENELMAFNCILGAMVHYNNRKNEKVDLVSATETAEFSKMIMEWREEQKRIKPSKEPFKADMGRWMEAVTKTLEDDIYGHEFDSRNSKYSSRLDKSALGPLSMHLWKTNIFGHLLFTLGLGAHSYENMPPYINGFYQSMSVRELEDLTYSEADNVPKSKYNKTRPEVWKKIFDIPVNAIYKWLLTDSTLFGRLSIEEMQLLMSVKQVLDAHPRQVLNILYAEELNHTLTNEELEIARSLREISAKIGL